MTFYPKNVNGCVSIVEKELVKLYPKSWTGLFNGTD